jgi:hypothetical protein
MHLLGYDLEVGNSAIFAVENCDQHALSVFGHKPQVNDSMDCTSSELL